MPSLTKEVYPPHLLAQKLNNRGAAMIETYQFDEAIAALVKALKLSEQSANDKACSCKFCSLDGCLSANHTGPLIKQDRQDSQSMIDKVKTSSHCLHCPTEEDSSMDESLSQSLGGYMYSKPIHVDTNSIKEGHNMGITLSQIIIFNLALAHQLEATAQRPSSTTSPNLRVLQKSLKLYELAYQLHFDSAIDKNECDDIDNIGNVRFMMIVTNNLGEIHRIASCRTKHEVCLQHLLQTIMYLVDRQHSIDSVELDGYLRNTSQILHHGIDICARAA
jgi:hypothetical protein